MGRLGLPPLGSEDGMAGIRFGPTPRDAEQRLAQTSTLSFTADSGPLMAELAGEGLAKKRGDALHRCWMRPVHTSGVILRGTFKPTGTPMPGAPIYLTGGSLRVVARFSSCSADLQVN